MLPVFLRQTLANSPLQSIDKDNFGRHTSRKGFHPRICRQIQRFFLVMIQQNINQSRIKKRAIAANPNKPLKPKSLAACKGPSGDIIQGPSKRLNSSSSANCAKGSSSSLSLVAKTISYRPFTLLVLSKTLPSNGRPSIERSAFPGNLEELNLAKIIRPVFITPRISPSGLPAEPRHPRANHALIFYRRHRQIHQAACPIEAAGRSGLPA